MGDTNKIPASQQLRDIAKQEQKAELARNEFQENSDEYNATKVPEEINDAEKERIKLKVMNQYNEDGEYKNPEGE